MKLTTLVILLIPFSVSIGQKANTCQILESILNYEPAKKPYYFDKNTSYPIIFYDTTKDFDNCAIGKYYGREVEVSHDFSSIEQMRPSDYIINIISRTKKGFKLLLNYKNSGAYSTFTLKRKKSGFKVISFRERYL